MQPSPIAETVNGPIVRVGSVMTSLSGIGQVAFQYRRDLALSRLADAKNQEQDREAQEAERQSTCTGG